MKCLPIGPPVSCTTMEKKNPVVIEAKGVGVGGLLPKIGSSENFAIPAGPLPLMNAREIPAAEI